MVINKRKRWHGNIFVLGPLIHNKKVVDFLSKKGIKTEKDLSKIPDGSVVVIRSHGAPKEVYDEIKKRDLILLDATCPKVKKVHQIVKKHIERGDSVIIVGDRNHAEVKGLLSFTGDRGYVVEKLEDIKKLPLEDRNWVVVAQTTQNILFFNKVLKELKKYYSNIKYYNTICMATHVRQDEVRKMAKEVDIMVVVGGKNSANTRRLAEISREEGIEAIHIEEADELKDLREYRRVGVTAGASTPHWITRRVISRIEEMSGNRVENTIRRFFTLLVRSNLYVALGAAALSYTACRMQSIEPKIIFEFIAATYIFSMHLFNQMSEWFYTEYLYPERIKFIEKNKRILLGISLGGVLLSIFFSLFLNFSTFILILIMIILGIIYKFPFKRFKLSDIPGSKDLFMAGAWATFLVLLHLFSKGESINAGTMGAFIYVFLISLHRSLIISYRDLQIDTILGRESLAIWLGELNVKLLLFIIPGIILALLMVFSFITGSSLWLFLMPVPLYIISISYLTTEHYLMREVIFEILVDGSLYLGGFLAYLWKLVYMGF